MFLRVCLQVPREGRAILMDRWKITSAAVIPCCDPMTGKWRDTCIAHRDHTSWSLCRFKQPWFQLWNRW